MSYEIKIERKALKFINRQDRPQRVRLLAAIHRLPDEGDRKALKGTPGVYRLRVGEYRVLYTVNNGQLIVTVIDAGNRGQIYK